MFKITDHLIARWITLLVKVNSRVLTYKFIVTGSDYSCSGTIGLPGIHFCYYQKASEQLQLGVEFETSIRLMEAQASIGYQVDIPKADLVFKGNCSFLIRLFFLFYNNSHHLHLWLFAFTTDLLYLIVTRLFHSNSR